MFLGCGADFCLSCFVSCCVLLGGIVPINHLCCTFLVRSFTVFTIPQRHTETTSHNVGPGPQPGSFQNPIDWLYFFQKECKIKILANLCWDRCCPTESPDGSTLGGFNHQCQGIFHDLFIPCPFLRVERGPGSCRGLVILTHPLVALKKKVRTVRLQKLLGQWKFSTHTGVKKHPAVSLRTGKFFSQNEQAFQDDET